MTNVLNDISNTPLEGNIKWVDTEDLCGECGETFTNEHQEAHLPENRLGTTWQASRVFPCVNCRKPRTFTVTKVTPSESQEDDW